jgi:urea transport system permease protein
VLADTPVPFEATIGKLVDADFGDKEAIAEQITQQRHPNAKAFLSALLEGEVFYRLEDKKIFIAKENGDQYDLIDPVTLGAAGSAAGDALDKVSTNNRLRKVLRREVASFDLSSTDRKARLDAINQMLRSADEDTTELLQGRIAQEKDKEILTVIRLGLAQLNLDNADAKVRLAAVKTLAASRQLEVRERLNALATPATDGTYVEPDAQVRVAAREAVGEIDFWRKIYGGIETLFFGLSMGSVLVLVAIGLAITFGVMGVINMAHGELMMLGAYTTYVVQLAMPNHIGLSVVIAVPLAFIVSGAMGVLIERGIVRFLYGRPLETLLATFGVSLLLQQLVRDVFSANNRPVQTPSWMSGSLQLNEALSITYNRLYVLIFALAVFAVVMLVLNKTSLGLKVRAVSQNRSMAKAMGVRTGWVDALTFGLGSGIAGIAGVALSQISNVGPNLGQGYIIDSFMVVVFGGVGNLWGTLVGGMTLGVTNKLLEPYSGAVFAKIFVLVALILFIQRRPRGLFPQKGRAAEA